MKIYKSVSKFIVVLLTCCCAACTQPKLHTLTILHTNDTHSQVEALEEGKRDEFCGGYTRRMGLIAQERKADPNLLVFDAGDFCQCPPYFNFYHGRIEIDAMNRMGYDVVMLGNHEFDNGVDTLAAILQGAQFPVVCANYDVTNSPLEDIVKPYTILRRAGMKIGVFGLGINPKGLVAEHNFYPLQYLDPVEAAQKTADILKHQKHCDVVICLSHLGTHSNDINLAKATKDIDIIIGGHTHAVLDTLINRTVIGQTGRYLAHIGATHIRMKGNKITSIEYRNIPLSNYAEDANTRALIGQIESDPVLGAPVGNFSEDITHTGFENFVSTVIAKATNSDIGFYHYGGLRIPLHPAGGIKLATVYNLEPFDTKIHTITMTRDQIAHMIQAKFNDTLNPKESHRIELYSTTPYTIVVDNHGEAVDVQLPTLSSGTKYRVALPSYVGQKHPNLKGNNHTEHNILVVDEILKELSKHQTTPVDNKFYQKILK